MSFALFNKKKKHAVDIQRKHKNKNKSKRNVFF